MRCRMGFNQPLLCAVRCALFVLCPLTAAAAAAAEMCRERRGVVRFRVKLSARPLDRARCLFCCKLQSSRGCPSKAGPVVTNSRLPCSTAEHARARYMPLLPPALVSGCTRPIAWCGAEDAMAGRYVLGGGPVPFPVGHQGLSTDFSSPCFRTLGGQDEGSRRLFIPSLHQCLA